jgi:hypothetical protein
MCVDQEVRLLTQMFKQFTGKPLTAEQQRALHDLSSGSTLNGGSGIVTSQVNGKWFVNPIQTFADGTTTLLRQFKDNDLLVLIGLFKQMALSPQIFGASGGSSTMCVAPPGQHC